MGLPPLLSLQGIYQDAYNAIVKPEQKFAVSHYFWKRWGPLLGPAGTWFIIALRQRCFWNERQDWCVVDSDTLAREAALSRRSLFRLLEGEGFLSWFFRREKRRQYNRRAGRYVLSPNLYIVRLDDPLVPADQAGLASLIHQNVLCLPNSAQVIMDFLSYLLKEKEFPFPEELAEEVHLSGKSFTVYEVVKEVLPEITRLGEEEKVRLRKICSELQNKITQPERVYLGTQYFRLKWLPRLGHTLASFIVALRTRCYWNEKTGELRDTIEVSLEEIAPEIGCTSRWLRNLRHQRFSLLFFEEIGQGLFRVQMRDPLTPEDQVLFEKMTASSPSQIDPQTGQLSALPLLEQTQAQSEEKNVPETGQNFWHIEPDILALRSGIFGTQKRNFWHLEGIPVEILEPEAEFLALRNGIFGTQKRNFWHLETEFLALRSGTFGTQSGIFGTTVKVLISTISTRGKLLQKHLEAEKENFVAAAFSLLLDSFGFNEPGKSRLLELKPNYIDAFAWMLYSFTQPGLEDKRQGYVYNRLIARDPPPEDFRLFAQLPPPVWNLFYKADRYGYPVPEELKPTFELWCKVYSGFFSAEPFEERTEEESIAQASEADEVEEKWLGTLSEMEGQLDETLLEGLRQCRVVKSDESERWAIFVRDLFLAWQLGQVREMVEATLGSPLEVRDWNCGREISPEVMNLKGLSPLAPEVWRKALAELALQMSQSTFNDWLRDSRTVGWIQDEEVIIGVRSERARGWLENRLRHLVERTLSGILGHPVSARFVVMYSGSLEG